MKLSFFNKALVCLFATGSLFLASCVDKSVDLDNLSGDMSLGGHLEFPVLQESRIDLSKLLERYEPDNTSKIKVHTDGDDIVLTYDTGFVYTMAAINTDFEKFAGSMKTNISEILKETTLGDILDFIGDESKTIPVGESETSTIEYPYNINNESQFEEDQKQKQKIDSILFLNTDIVIRIETPIDIKTDGFLTLKIKIPGSITDSLFVSVKGNGGEYRPDFGTKDFSVLANAKFGIRFIITGDNETEVSKSDQIHCTIEFESRDEIPRYVAYGWFNFDYTDEVKIESLAVNLSNYIPGTGDTQLSIAEPKFMFNVQSDLGLPIEFKIDTIRSEFQDSKDDAIFIFPDGVTPFTIERANKFDPEKEEPLQSFEINNGYFAQDQGKSFSDFISTDLNSLTFVYKFAAEKIEDFENTDVPIQFIASDSELKIDGKLEVPLFFGAGSVICYRDTMDLDIDPESLEDVSLLDLRFTYTNHTPIGFYVDLYLLDESHHNILGKDKVYQTIEIGKAVVDSDGVVDESKLAPKDYSLPFTKETGTPISEMGKAKYLDLSYRSVKKGDSEPSIRLKSKDYLTLKLGVAIDGKIVVK
jgi:hypothetical protein